MFNFNIKDDKYKKIHFIGIGGISMSGLALLMNHHNFIVTGSDRSDSDILNELRNKGIKISIGQSKENVKDQDLFVYTDAIPADNEELIAARSTGRDVVSRGIFLGALMKNFEQSIAVSGSHGKSTTTSMIAKILVNSEDDSTILLGGMLDEIKGNVKFGTSEILLMEACEFKGNIRYYYPSTVVILNIDADHLDYYRDLNHIVDTFKEYMDNISTTGKAILNIDDSSVVDLIDHVKGKVITFGIKNEKADYNVLDITYSTEQYPHFKLKMKNGEIVDFKLNIRGDFNVINAVAAIVATYENGIDLNTIKNSLEDYKALHRRLELIGNFKDTQIYTDFGHHPVEIKATLNSVMNFTDKKIISVFEPHTYSRTKSLLDDFANSFYGVDEVIVTDIYAAREKFDPTIHSKDLVEKLLENGVNAKYIKDFEGAKNYLQKKINKDDLVITQGCGKADVLAKMIVDKL